MKKLDVTKPCQMRNGVPVTYLGKLENEGNVELIFKFARGGIERTTRVYEDGKYLNRDKDSEYDILQIVEKREVWAVLRPSSKRSGKTILDSFDSLAEAEYYVNNSHFDNAVIKHFTWEE